MCGGSPDSVLTEQHYFTFATRLFLMFYEQRTVKLCLHINVFFFITLAFVIIMHTPVMLPSDVTPVETMAHLLMCGVHICE